MKSISIVEFASDRRNLSQIRDFFAKAVAESGLCIPVRDVKSLELAVNELCENIMKHGYNDGAGSILMTVHITRGMIAIMVIDTGLGYDLVDYTPMPKEMLVENGIKGKLGINMIKSFCDGVYYKRINERNVTVLLKYFEHSPDNA